MAQGQGLVLKRIELLPVDWSPAGVNWGAEYSHEMMDFDGNGTPEIVLKGNPGFIVYGMPGFNPLWTAPSNAQFDGIGSNFETVFADLTGDGIKEVVWYYGNHVSVNSVSENQIILVVDSVSNNFPYLIRDYDGDGLPDLMICIEDHSDNGHLLYRLEFWGAGTVNSSPPSNLVASTDSDNVILNWQPVDSCSLYNISWALNPLGPFARVGRSALPKFTHNGAAILPRAYYRVTAVTSTDTNLVVGSATFAGTVVGLSKRTH